MTDRPVFIVGAQRSGTTLVRLLLDAHPSIAIGPETGFVDHVRHGAALVEGTARKRVRQDGYALGTDLVERELAAAWDRLLRTHAAAVGASRWGDKTPKHRYRGATIRRLFPDAHLVAVVRHPAAVAVSRQRWGYQARETIDDWGASIRFHVADAARFGARRFHLVRYEDVLAEPAATVAALLDALGEPWHDAVLDHTAGVEPGLVTDGRTVRSQPLDPSRALAWTGEVDDATLEAIEELAGDELALLGYVAERDTPVRALPRNDLTAPPALPSTARVVSRVLREDGPAEVVRLAVARVRAQGLLGTLRRVR